MTIKYICFDFQIIINGCLFHCSQALYKKISDVGLRVEYSTMEAARTPLREALALPFLKSKHISSTLKDLIDIQRELADARAKKIAYMTLIMALDNVKLGITM